MTTEQLMDIALLADSTGITVTMRPSGFRLSRGNLIQYITYESAADAIDPLSIFKHHMMMVL